MATRKNAETEVQETITVENVAPVEKKKEKRKYEASDGILCRSITQGVLCMKGIKSGVGYKWAGNRDETEVEYQDLVAAIRSNASYVMKPLFIIEDEDFIAQYPQLKKVYDSMYSIKDLRDVLKLSVPSMKKTIKSMPDGAKDSIKHIASEMITKGTLDSVQKIKALDEIFGTKMLLMTANAI